MPDQNGREYAASLERLRASSESRFQTRLNLFFDSVASAAANTFRSGGNVVATVGVHSSRLGDIMLPLYLQTGEGVQASLQAFYGYRALPNRTPFINLAGERIGGINAETKRLVQDVLKRGLAEDATSLEVQKQLRGVLANPKRAKTITRTELASFTNQSQAEVMRLNGESHVETLDADDCGWSGHDDSTLANGRIVTIAQADSQPISHPNCVRAFTPTARSNA